jgi:uncharacterized protein YyaL (SSP411 family)
LAGFTNEICYVDIGSKALAQMQTPIAGGMMSQHPLGFGKWLQALAYALSKPREVAIVGDPDSADTQVLISVVRDGYQPFQVVAAGAPSLEGAQVPLLQSRGLVDGRAAAYACRAFACQQPATDPEALRAQLGQG